MITTITQRSKTSIRLPYKWLIILLSILAFFASGLEAQELVWAKHLEGGDSEQPNGATAIAHDGDGNIYIIGTLSSMMDFDPGTDIDTLSPMGERDVFLAKYDVAGNYLWARRIMGGPNASCEGNGLTVDAAGNVYVTGNFNHTSYFATPGGMDSIDAVGVFGVYNIYLCKYSSEGDFMWVQAFPTISSPGTETTFNTAVDCSIGRSGYLYITGTFLETVDFNPGGAGGELSSLNDNSVYYQQNAFIAKYDTAGNYIWAGGLVGPGRIMPYGIAIDTSGTQDKLLVCGNFQASASNYLSNTIDFDPSPATAELAAYPINRRHTFLAKYSSDGEYIWANVIYPDTASVGSGPHGYNVEVDAYGNVVTTGTVGGAADFDPGPGTATVTAGGIRDMFLAKYDPDGNYIWAQATEGTGSVCIGHSLTFDNLGIIYVTGTFSWGSVDFDPGSGSEIRTPNEAGLSTEAFVAQYGNCGTLLSVMATKGGASLASNTSAEGIINKDNDMYIAGNFKGSVDFDPGPDTSIFTGNAPFIARFHYAVDSNITSFLELSVCEDSFTINDQTYTESGVYQQWLPGVSQCDSIIVLDLTLNYIEEPMITVNEFELGVVNSYDSYQWLKDGEAIAGATSATYLVTENGPYQVAVSNDGGCSDTSAIYIVNNVGIDDTQGLGKQVRIYPNPTADMLYISSPVAVDALLCSMDGRLVIRKEQVRSLSLKGLANGLYLLQLTDKEGRTIRYEKIVCQPR